MIISVSPVNLLAVLIQSGLLVVYSIKDQLQNYTYILTPMAEIDFSEFVEPVSSSDGSIQIESCAKSNNLLIDNVPGDDFLFVYAFSYKDSKHFVYAYNLSKPVHVRECHYIFSFFSFQWSLGLLGQKGNQIAFWEACSGFIYSHHRVLQVVALVERRRPDFR